MNNRQEKIAALKAIGSGKAKIEDFEPTPIEVWLTDNGGVTWKNSELNIEITEDNLLKRKAIPIRVNIVGPPTVNCEADVDTTRYEF